MVDDLATLEAVRLDSGLGSEIDPAWCGVGYDHRENNICFAGNRDGHWAIYRKPESGGQASGGSIAGATWNDTSPAYPAGVAN